MAFLVLSILEQLSCEITCSFAFAAAMVVEGQLLVVGAALSHVIASTSSCSTIHALVYLSGTNVVYIYMYIENKGNRNISAVPFLYVSAVCVL